MKFVITGALGHIGSLLIRNIFNWYPDCSLIMIDNISSERYCSLFNLPKSNKFFIKKNIIDIEIDELFKDVNFVIHLAAITNAEASINNAKEVENNNFISTKKIADTCNKLSIPMIHISSTSVYGSSANKVDESCGKEELKPQSPYADTKLKEENYLQKLAYEGNLKVSILRFGTIFGISPGMRFHTAVNKFCFQASIGEPLTVWKTAYNQMRPYLYLEDAMQAFKLIIDKNEFNNEIFNVLSGNYSVKNIIDEIKLYYPNLDLIFVDSKIMNQLSYEVIFEKFKSLGFNPHGSIKKGIRETLELININREYSV